MWNSNSKIRNLHRANLSSVLEIVNSDINASRSVCTITLNRSRHRRSKTSAQKAGKPSWCIFFGPVSMSISVLYQCPACIVGTFRFYVTDRLLYVYCVRRCLRYCNSSPGYRRSWRFTRSTPCFLRRLTTKITFASPCTKRLLSSTAIRETVGQFVRKHQNMQGTIEDSSRLFGIDAFG